MNITKKALFLFAFFLFSTASDAQTGKLYDGDNQLSSSFTTQVFLDRDGFIWVLTRNGLNRSDGYQFHIIKKEQERNQGMANNYVNCMTQDDNGLFYFGMYGALQTYDGNQFTDVEVKNLQGHIVNCYMTCFLRRKNGQLLAGTSGHGLLHITDLRHAHQMGGVLENLHTVYDMAEDAQGHLWMVTNNGLLETDGTTFCEPRFNDDGLQAIPNRLCHDRQGNLYVGTIDGGVYVGSSTGNDFRHITSSGTKQVSTLYQRHDGRMMFGYDGEGVAIYDPETEETDDNPYYSRDVDLSKSKIYSIVEDSCGNIWLGLLQKGVFMQHRAFTNFHYMGFRYGPRNVIGQACVISTLVDSKGRCWVGTDKDGLYCIDREARPLKHFKQNFPSSVLSLTEDSHGRIWVGSYRQGFGYIEADGQTYHPFPQYRKTSVFSLKGTKDGKLWVGTMGQGLLQLDLSDNHLRTFTTDAEAPQNPKKNSLSNDYINHISLSSDEKRLYVGTTQGLCCLDIERNDWTTTFGRNCLAYSKPILVSKEYAGRIWIGTNDGLYCYDMLKKTMEPYDTARVFTDGNIASIEQDKEGRLWFSTSHGLICHNPQTGKTESYFVDNGLQSNEFTERTSCSFDHGDCLMLLFGGVGGITWFCPKEIKPLEWDANVRLVEFFSGRTPINQTSRSGQYQVCDTTVIAATTFHLAHNKNTFSVRFSTLTYDSPEHTTYLYSINDEPFTRMQMGINELSFSRMQPGTYHFRVKAERYNRLTPEREFTVIIHSPWYNTWMARIAYLLIITLLVWRYLHYLRHKSQVQLRLQEHIHAEEMINAKLQFFMNISHEIRTPMTLIITPLTTLIKNEDNPQRRHIYETIKRNADRILHLINQMMDLRKIDKGLMQIRATETDLVPFISELHSLFEQQASSRQIKLSFHHEMESLLAWIDRKNFDKVIMNILSNAFKFTPTGGTIDIRLTTDGKNATITVSDNGEQIPEDKLDKIFERFYQVPESIHSTRETREERMQRQYTGTGIGLDLTRSLVELHHGTVTAHNLQQGCEFVVTIPLGNEHLKPEEIVTEDVPQTLLPETVSAELPTEEEETIPPIQPVANDKKPTIIIAEDDDEIRQFLSSELAQDYNIISLSNGKDALSMTLRTLPHLVISDIMMPEMNGNLLCSKIKTNPSTNHIPVVLLTAKNRDEDKLEGLDSGADAYVVKPFNMEILRRTISNIIYSHRLLQLKYSHNDQLEEKIDDIKVVSPDQKLMERVINVINQHISDSSLSVDFIANEVGISRVHLYRKMKELTGQTPHEFIRNIRLKKAANLLAQKSLNVSEVTYICGFANIATFSSVFKKFYGVSPRDFVKDFNS
jgi:signal transduction histidine kinase/ligand-binding sensor domain-containing protein/DNA-binding response OmpR family regulator